MFTMFITISISITLLIVMTNFMLIVINIIIVIIICSSSSSGSSSSSSSSSNIIIIIIINCSNTTIGTTIVLPSFYRSAKTNHTLDRSTRTIQNVLNTFANNNHTTWK